MQNVRCNSISIQFQAPIFTHKKNIPLIKLESYLNANPPDAENQNADDGILSTPDTFGAVESDDSSSESKISLS
jgi:hypothetical protein